MHGNAGLNPPFGTRIHSFAKSLADLDYVVAVPQYYLDDQAHPDDGDPRPHVPTLSDAIAKVAARTDADPDRLGLIGYSLGAATAMTYIASNAAGKVKVLVDFFGPIEGNPIIASEIAKFPPTIIFHNTADLVVGFLSNSKKLDGMLPSSIEHLLVPYTEASPSERNHPFIQDGPADVELAEASDGVGPQTPRTPLIGNCRTGCRIRSISPTWKPINVVHDPSVGRRDPRAVGPARHASCPSAVAFVEPWNE